MPELPFTHRPWDLPMASVHCSVQPSLSPPIMRPLPNCHCLSRLGMRVTDGGSEAQIASSPSGCLVQQLFVSSAIVNLCELHTKTTVEIFLAPKMSRCQKCLKTDSKYIRVMAVLMEGCNCTQDDLFQIHSNSLKDSYIIIDYTPRLKGHNSYVFWAVENVSYWTWLWKIKKSEWILICLVSTGAQGARFTMSVCCKVVSLSFWLQSSNFKRTSRGL